MVNVYSLDGKVKGKVELPKAFSTPYRPDLIQRTVIAEQAAMRQPYSTDPEAGLRTSGDYFGSRQNRFRQTINKGNSRLPRLKTGGGGLGRVIRLPQTKGGRRAHPPKGKDYSRKINRKEWKLALFSAIAATASKELVEARSHIFKGAELPIVVEDKFQGLKKTSEVVKALKAIGLGDEMDSKKKKKVLIVVAEDGGILKAAGGLDGVDVATLDDLDMGSLAPGTHAGRLTLWSESALKGVK
ncbi:MAG: 50S ribosomal protein L4 [Candidatus Altiarchaeota archaeon]